MRGARICERDGLRSAEPVETGGNTHEYDSNVHEGGGLKHSKLLAVIAVLAVALCAFAIAIPATDAEVPTYAMDDGDDKAVITYVPEEGKADTLTLSEAMIILQDSDVSGGTMTFPAGQYDVSDSVVKDKTTYTGSAFVIKASGITIKAAEGATVTVYAGASNNGNATPMDQEIPADKDAGVEAYTKYIAQQDMIYVSGTDVTIDGLTVMNMICWCADQGSDTPYYQAYKSITVVGTADIKNVNLVPNTLGETPLGEYAYTTWGGSILVQGTVTVDNVVVDNGSINTGWANEGNSVSITNTTIIAKDDMCTGLRNTKVVDNEEVSGSVTPTATNVVIDITSNKVDASRLINTAVAGTTVEVNADVTLDAATIVADKVSVSVATGKTVTFGTEGSLTVSGTLVNGGTLGATGDTDKITVSSGTVYNAPKATINGLDEENYIDLGAEDADPMPVASTSEIDAAYAAGVTDIIVGELTIESDYVLPGAMNIEITEGDLTVAAGVNLDLNGSSITSAGGNSVVLLGTTGSNAAHATMTVDGGSISAKIKDGSDVSSMESSGTIVLVKNLSGNFSVAHGSLVIDGIDDGSAVLEGGVLTVYHGDVKISGSLNGTLQIVKDGDLDANVTFEQFIINNNGTLELDSGINYSVNAIDGYVYLYGAIKPYGGAIHITINVAEKNAFTAFNGAKLTGGILVTGKGNIDLSKAQNPQNVGEDISDDKTYGQLEDVTIIDSLTIKNDATVTVKGGFTVNEDVTLTIENGSELTIDSAIASMIVNGSIVVEEGGKLTVKDSKEVAVSGSIESEGTVTIGTVENPDVNVTVKSGGSVLIDEATDSSVVIYGGLTIEADGAMTIRDNMDIQSITNKGVITLDGAVLGNDSTIKMAADGAVVEIDSVTGAHMLTVTDLGMQFPDYATNSSSVVTGDNDNEVCFTCTEDPCTEDQGIRGLVITESITRSGKVYQNSMDLSGSIAVENVGEDDDTAKTVTVAGPRLTVASELTIGKNVTLAVAEKSEMTVSGTVTAVAEKSKVDNKGEMTVTGLVQTIDKVDPTINAALYEQDVDGDTNYFYTNFVAAVNSGADKVEVLGTVTVPESITVPATTDIVNSGTLVVGEDTKAGRDVVLTIADGSEINRGIVDVNGTLYFENKKNQKANDIWSDVEIIGDVDATYTNIYTALANADAGDTVTITSDNEVLITSNLTIPEGVTLEVPNTKHLAVLEGVTLTVNGTLTAYHKVRAVDTDKTSDGLYDVKASVKTNEERAAIVVNGTFMTAEPLEYGYYKSAGAYYSMVGDAGVYNYVTPLAAAAAVATQVEQGLITVNGTVTAGDVQFVGTEVDGITIVVSAGSELTVSSIALSYAEFYVEGTFSGTVTVGDAGISAYKVHDLDVDSDSGLVIGNVTVKHLEDGKNVAKLSATAGTVVIDGTVYGSMTVDAGATLTVPSANSSDKTGTVDGALTVNGAVSVTSGQTMYVTGKMYVAGTVTVAAETDTAAAGTLDVTGKMYVGLNAKYSTTSTSASVTGPVDVDIVYAVAGSTVSESTLEALTETTAYNVEGSVWMTAYMDPAMDSKGTVGDVTSAPVENAYFDGDWLDSDGVNVNSSVIGVKETVYADIEYDIYVVNIRADQNAVSSISIDGNLMQFGMIIDVTSDTPGVYYGFTATVSAGSHTISYQLANGYSGDGVLSVLSGDTTVSGLTFTAEGTPTEDPGKITYNLQLSGFEKSGYVPDSPDTPSTPTSSDDGMTITDYLLIVLVVLIIVMAIIVAMRLMRS